MVEAGFLPSNDFVLINKVQQALGINLRKDKKDFSKSANEMMKKNDNSFSQNKPKEKNDFLGRDIELFDDEI